MKRPTDVEYILLAADQYADDEHEFDNVISFPVDPDQKPYVKYPRPKVSVAEDGSGAWVQGWYWVANPDFEDEEDEIPPEPEDPRDHDAEAMDRRLDPDDRMDFYAETERTDC